MCLYSYPHPPKISFFIVVSSSAKYAEYLGGSPTFSGLVIGIPAFFGGLALIPMTRFDKGRRSCLGKSLLLSNTCANLGGYALSLHAGCFSAILGHIVYATAYRSRFLYMILIGRCLNGISFTGFMYAKRYCTDHRIVGIRRRTTLASFLVIGQGLGMSLGPFLGGLLYKIGFSSPTFNGYTSPGWVMAGVYVVFWVFVALYFEDVSQVTSAESLPMARPNNTPDNDNGNSITPTTLNTSVTRTSVAFLAQFTAEQWGVILCMCWFSMSCFFILGSWEANLPVFGANTPNLQWSPFSAGNFIALGGITSFPFLLANIFLARRTQDRNLLAFGSGLGLLGLLVFVSLLRSGKVDYVSLFVCWWAVALGFNLTTTVTISLLSKQLSPEWNRWSSMAIQYSNYTGRVTGAVWGGSGVSVGMLHYVGLEIAIIGIGAVLFIMLWRNLKTKTG